MEQPRRRILGGVAQAFDFKRGLDGAQLLDEAGAVLPIDGQGAEGGIVRGRDEAQLETDAGVDEPALGEQVAEEGERGGEVVLRRT